MANFTGAAAAGLHYARPLMADQLPKPPILAFLAKPVLLFMACYLLNMLALSFGHQGIHSLAMKTRWIALGAAAVMGVGLALAKGAGGWRAPEIGLAIFVALACATSLYSIDKSYSFQRAVSVAMLFAATMIGVRAYCRDIAGARGFTDLLWCLSAVVALLGFLLTGGEANDAGRYEGLYGRATGAGTYAAVFLPIAVYQARYRLTGVWKFVGWGVIALLFGQALLAGARQAIVVSFCICLALWWQYHGAKALLGLALAAVLAPLALLADPNRAEKLQNKSEQLLRLQTVSTFTGRLDRWVFGLEQFARKPIQGHGFGASRTLASREDPGRFKLKPDEVFNLHSDQIEVMMDTGVIGYLPFAVFWIAAASAGVGLWRRKHPLQPMALAYYGSFLYTFVDTFMHGSFLAAGGGTSSFTWSMAAVFLTLERRTRQPMGPPVVTPSWRHEDIETVARHSHRSVARDRLPSVRDLPRRPALATSAVAND